MTDQDSGRQQLKGTKRAHDSDLFTYITKLEQQVIQKRTLIVKERRKFQIIIQSLAKYLDMKGISAKIVEEFLDSVKPPTVVIDDNDIADWYAYLEGKNQIIKKALIGPTNNHTSIIPEVPKSLSSNIIRITKQDLSQQPLPGSKQNKKIKKEDAKQQSVDEVLQKLEQSENNSVHNFNERISTLKDISLGKLTNEQAESTKQKRKRRTKKEMLDAKQHEIQEHKGLGQQEVMMSSLNSQEIQLPPTQLSSYLPGFKQNGHSKIHNHIQTMQEQGLFDLKQIDGFHDQFMK